MTALTPAISRSPADPQAAVVQSLGRALADSYTLYLKTQNFHWNVTGPSFHSLHALFEQQYLDLAQAVDALAERMRALGAPAPGSYRAFAELSEVEDEPGRPSAEQMVRILIADNATTAAGLQAAADLAEEAGDRASADLLVARVQAHQKNIWMLRSSLPV